MVRATCFAILVSVNTIDPAQALDVASKALAAIVSLVGLVVAIGQLTRPAVLKRRAKWLQETIEQERNEDRLSTLKSMLDGVNAALVAGVLVPVWRFLPLVAGLLLGPLQAFIWVRNDPGLGSIIGALSLSLAISTFQVRRGIRLLAERYRVAHEYREGAEPVRQARLGILHQMEGGTRAEMGFGLFAAIGITASAVGVALVYLEQVGWGVTIALGGALITLIIIGVIRDYVLKRVGIYGPWSVENSP